jgi:hypothetical protein
MTMKVSSTDLAIIRDMGAAFLADKGYTFNDVTTGRDAWTVLHRSGAYMSLTNKTPGGYPDYKDAHLQTALAHIMPNAVFNDKKVY